MSEFERRLRELATRLTQWRGPSSRTAGPRGTDGAADLRREARVRAREAASRVQDFRASERGQRAADKLGDLRASETARKAESAFNDLRASETGQKAESALAGLRQRETVKKAEESARKAVHDLFSGGSGTTGDRQR